MNKIKILELIARIGVFGTFFGHGLSALSINIKWIPLLTCYGFSVSQAKYLLPIIGTIDIVIAFLVLIYPIRIILFWAIFWAFLTALSRPISGGEFLEFIERSANWCLPLVLLILQGFPKSFKEMFQIRS
jgi:hypothetical protein